MTEQTPAANYGNVHSAIIALLEAARRTAARSVNAVMTATYWEIGRRIVESEQAGESRANYGEQLLKRLAEDLTARFGRGFGLANLRQMRNFYLAWPPQQIHQTLSGELALGINNNEIDTGLITLKSSVSPATTALPPATLSHAFPLPWSAYVRLLSVKNGQARKFYETMLPDEKLLEQELERTRLALENRHVVTRDKHDE